MRELLENCDTKDMEIEELRRDLHTTQRQLEKSSHDIRRARDDIESYRYEIAWKNERISFLEAQLAKLDPTGAHIDTKTTLQKKAKKHKKTSKSVDSKAPVALTEDLRTDDSATEL